MEWHHLRDPLDPKLDDLALQFHLHPLHIEDCRHRNQSAKVEEDERYLFVVLKPVKRNPDGSLEASDLDIFLGRDFLITVQESEDEQLIPLFEAVRATSARKRPDQAFYQIMDRLVDSYLPTIDCFKDTIDGLEDRVLEDSSPKILQEIFRTKRSLVEMRRVVANMRDVAAHLQRTRDQWIPPKMWPFFRDVYDHLARSLDSIDVERDLLSNCVDIYLSNAANQTNRVMKALTILSTIALPALVISSFYGMNVHTLPWAESLHAHWIVLLAMATCTVLLLGLLKLLHWL